MYIRPTPAMRIHNVQLDGGSIYSPSCTGMSNEMRQTQRDNDEHIQVLVYNYNTIMTI